MKRYAGGWVGVRGALGAEMPCPAQNRDENMALATKPYFICKRNEHYMENDLIHSIKRNSLTQTNIGEKSLTSEDNITASMSKVESSTERQIYSNTSYI